MKKLITIGALAAVGCLCLAGGNQIIITDSSPPWTNDINGSSLNLEAVSNEFRMSCFRMFGPGPQQIPARLEWTVTTNWTPAYQSRTLMFWTGDKDPNVTTYHETGMIQSNLVAYVEWKGKVFGVVVETVHVGTTNRSYTMSESVRVYQ